LLGQAGLNSAENVHISAVAPEVALGGKFSAVYKFTANYTLKIIENKGFFKVKLY